MAPTMALIVWPPIVFLGCETGASGIAYKRTALAPNEVTVSGMLSNAPSPLSVEIRERPYERALAIRMEGNAPKKVRM